MYRKYSAIGLGAAMLAVAIWPGIAIAANAQRGAQLFAQCQTCHTAQKGAGNGLGPNLFGVVGRRAGAVPGFSYSSALKTSRISWSNDKLKLWITNPSKLVPGTRMFFPGINDAGKRDDLVAYLDTLK
jgi:cytochrome c